MNIQELEDKHQAIIGESDLNYPEYLIEGLGKDELVEKYEQEEKSIAKEATKVSMEFAISILEDLHLYAHLMSDLSAKTFLYRKLENKIQELKQHLNEY